MILTRAGWLRTLGILLGLVCLGYLAKTVDLGKMATVGLRIGWGLPIILSLMIPKYLLYSISWRKIIVHLGGRVSLKTLFRIKLIGESVSYSTPLNVVGGDSSRLLLLRSHLPFKEAGFSILLDRFSHMISGFVIMLAGGVCLLSMGLPILEKLRPPSDRPILFPLVMAGLILLIGWIMIRRKITFSWRPHLNVIVVAITLTTLGRLLSVLEIYLIGLFIHVPLTFVHALVLNALSLGLTTLFAFIPSGIGVIEGGFAGYFALLGWSPEAGLAVELVRRVNGLFWILCGGIVSLVKPRGVQNSVDGTHGG